MKKTLIALAAVAATSAAFAQSSVTAYGLIDLGVAASKDSYRDGAATQSFKKNGLESMLNGSRFGFRGTEDLGGGLKGNFLLEYAVQPDEATTSMANRQAYVGLAGEFGEVRLGRQYTAYHSHQAGFDMVNGNTNTLPGYLVGWTTRVRSSNAINYTTPNFSGVTASVQYGFGESVDASGVANDKNNNNWGFNLKYANGPLVVGLGYDKVKNPKGTAGDTVEDPAVINWTPVTGASKTNKAQGFAGFEGSDSLTTYNLAASYDLGVAKVAVQYFNAKEKYAAGEGDGKFTGYVLGVSAPVTSALTLSASYSDGTVKESGVKVDDAKGYQLLAGYALSKRTTVYAAYGQDKLKATDGSEEAKRSQYGVGVRDRKSVV